MSTDALAKIILESGMKMLTSDIAEETNPKTDTGANATAATKESTAKEAEEEELKSHETLRDSPVQWPDRFPGMEAFVSKSRTPIRVPEAEFTQSQTLKRDVAALNQFACLPPAQLIDKINSMYDEIYQLGLRESKEMTRGKLLGIFDQLNNAIDKKN